MSDTQPQLTISCFGPFQASGPFGKVEFPNLVSAKLIAFLCSRTSRPFFRNDVADALWPEFDQDRQKANLRTALSTARKAIPNQNLILADRQTIQLNYDLVESDVKARLHWRSVSSLSPDRDTEISALEKELKYISKPYLDGWDDPWIIRLRNIWKRRRVDALTQLAQCFERCGRFEEAFASARAALKDDAFSSEALAAILRSCVSCDKAAEGYACFLHSQALMKEKLGASHSPAILRLADRAKSLENNPVQSLGASLSTPQERDALIKTFENALQNNPESAVNFLADNFKVLSYLPDIEGTLKLITTAIGHAKTPNKNVLKLNRLAFFLNNYLSRYEEAILIAKSNLKMLQGEENEVERSYFLSNYGFTLMETRDYAGAQAAFDEGERLALKHGDDLALANLYANLAGHKLHQMEFDVAESLYDQRLSLVPQEATTPDMVAICVGNKALISLFKEDWPNVIARAEEAMPYAEAVGSPYINSLMNAILALGYAATNRSEEARTLLVEAVRQCSRANLPRMTSCVFDVVAEALCYLHQVPDGVELAFASTELRDSIGHKRSPAEQHKFDNLVQTFCGGNCNPKKVLQDQSMASIFAWIIAKLKDHPAQNQHPA